jgi:cytoskeletal protein CcmA (bactofilin family)
MRGTITMLGAACAVLLAAAPTLAAQDFHWTGKLAAGKRLEIKGVNGAIRAMAASGDQIEVTAHKTARRSDPDEVEIKVVPFEDGVAICAVYPTPRRARRENSCEAGDDWSSSTDNNDVEVDFTIKLPAGINFDGRTVNGDLQADNLGADADVSTVNGSVDVSAAGHVEATTVNGSIRAAMGRSDWESVARFTTVNGGITLTLPANLNAEVRAETVNGDLETDFPLTVTGKFGPRHLRGTIGSGGRSLELRTVNGSITLRKAS